MYYNIDSVASIYGSKDLGEIFIGDAKSATDLELIRALNITHILNAAEGDVPTGSKYYNNPGFMARWAIKRNLKTSFQIPNNIQYLGIRLVDWPNENISLYFDQAADFIHHCMTHKGKIIVHCFAGISRSATFVIAYLIKYCGYGVDEAINFLRQKRAQINPNSGFISQLTSFHHRLHSTNNLVEGFCGCKRPKFFSKII